jgi:hypothetical protein
LAALTACTDRWAVFDHDIGRRHQPQGLAPVPQLSPRLLAARRRRLRVLRRNPSLAGGLNCFRSSSLDVPLS